MPDWDKRYREGAYNKGRQGPHELLRRFYPLIPRGTVIDVAMGVGKDGLFLAGEGYRVWGIERSAEALKIAREAMTGEGLAMNIVQGDVLTLPFRRGLAQGVTVFYFLNRSIMRDLADLLKKGGIMIYETFLKRQNLIDRERDPEFLLDDGELISFFRDFNLLFYEEGITVRDGRRRATAQFVGRKL